MINLYNQRRQNGTHGRHGEHFSNQTNTVFWKYAVIYYVPLHRLAARCYYSVKPSYKSHHSAT